MVFLRRKLTMCIPWVVIPLLVITAFLQFSLSPLTSTKFDRFLNGPTVFVENNDSSVPCVNELLESIDPTVSFKQFCDRTWTQSDIICKQFLYQNGMALKDNCVFPRNNNLVPRLVYYVIFSPKPGQPPEFLFMHYLSILSAKRYLSPWAIYVISDSPPAGYWWMRVLSDIRGVRHVFRELPSLLSENVVFIQHSSDIVRLQTLIVNGGIYMDTDLLLLQPIDVLLNTSLSMGLLDNNTGMGNAFIVAERQNPLIVEWYEGYRHYNKTSFFGNSLLAAKKLWLKHPGAINEISSRIYRPNWFESEKMFKQAGYNFSSQLGVHIWHRHGHVPTGQSEMDSLNSTLGEIFRFLYYGNKTLRTI